LIYLDVNFYQFDPEGYKASQHVVRQEFVRNLSESSFMLQCNMTNSMSLGLDDLLSDLQQACWADDLGRLALIAYCDVRCWARQAGEYALAERSTAMFTEQPHASREVFLAQIDQLIGELLQARSRVSEPAATA
jgi:hypothetical protein